MTLLFLMGCDPADESGEAGLDLQLGVNAAVGSVVELAVQSEEASTLQITYGVGEERNHSVTVPVAAAAHAVHLYGLPYGYEVGVTVEERHYPEVDHVNMVLALSRPLRGRAPVFEEMVAFLKAHIA